MPEKEGGHMQETLEFTADRIKMIRVRLNMTQEEFADHYGFTENSVARWETGENVPTKVKSLNGLLRAARDAG
jgi:DNA-binding transcriptional regulator YiaG